MHTDIYDDTGRVLKESTGFFETKAARLVNLVTAWQHEIKEMMGGMGINSIEALKGNRLMLRGVGTVSYTHLRACPWWSWPCAVCWAKSCGTWARARACIPRAITAP